MTRCRPRRARRPAWITALLAALTLVGPGCDPGASPVEPWPPPPPGWVAPPPPGTPGYDGPPPAAPWRLPPRLAATAPAPEPAPELQAPEEPSFAFRIRALETLDQERGQLLLVGDPGLATRWALHPSLLVSWSVDGPDAAALRVPGSDETAEAALTTQLHEQGIRFLLVDRAAASRLPAGPGPEGAVADTILRRLADARPLTQFHPVAIGPRYVLHRLAPSLALTADDGGRLIAGLRAHLDPMLQPPASTLTVPPGVGGLVAHEVLLSIRQRRTPEFGGQPIVRTLGRGVTPGEALRDAAAAASAAWPERIQALATSSAILLPATLQQALDEVEIELSVVQERTELLDRSPARLPALLELGVHGLELTVRETGARHVIFPADGVRQGHASARRLVEHLCRDQARLRRDAWQAPAKVQLHRLRTHDFLEAEPGGPVVELYRATTFVPLSAVDPPALRAALDCGLDHLRQLQTRSGRFLYRTRPLRNRWLLGPRFREQARSVAALLADQRRAPDGDRLVSAWRGLRDLFSHLRCTHRSPEPSCLLRHHDAGDVAPTAEVAAAAWTALALIRLAEFRPLDPDRRFTLERLGAHLLQMQDPNGHFRQYAVPPRHPQYGCAEPAAPGQILLALASLHRHTGEARYREAYDRGVAYHVAQWRAARDRGVAAEALGRMATWLVLALAALPASAEDGDRPELALELQDWLDARWLISPGRARYPDDLGGGWRPAGRLPDASEITRTAARAAALQAAHAVGRPTAELERRLRWGLRYALQLQFRDVATTAYYLPQPWLALGGVRDGLARSTLHTETLLAALLAFERGAQVLGGDPNQ